MLPPLAAVNTSAMLVAPFAVQLDTRPSEFVTALNVAREEDDGEAECDVSVTEMLAPGRPRTVSSTWQVIGSRAAAMVGCGGWMCEVMA